jgi:multidrug transporter EmrE-like cation transporter
MIIDAYFFDIFGTIAFIIILCIGIKFSKYKINHVKLGGYTLIVIAIIGLIVDLFNIISHYVIK